MSIFARFSRYLSAWVVAFPIAVCLVLAAALAVIYLGTFGTEGAWVYHGIRLNKLQLIAVLAAVCCVPLGAREGRGSPLRLWQLFRLPALAAGVTIPLLAMGGPFRLPLSMMGMAFGVGLLVGVARGLTMTLQFDHMWKLISLPRAVDTLCVAILLTLAAGMSIGVALGGHGGSPYGLAAMTISVLSGSFVAGRSAAISLRSWRLPHIDLHSSGLFF